MKLIARGDSAKEKLLEGFKTMYDTVGITYSPAGRNVAYGRVWGMPKIVHDGVTVSKEVEVQDELVEIGVKIIRDAAENQVDKTGDGTTLTTILTYHLFEKGIKYSKEKNINSMILRKQVLAALPQVLEEVKKLSKPIKRTKDDIKKVAQVSSDDKEITEAVTEAVERVGANGLVTVELNKKQKIETEYTEGMEIERGYGNNSIFVTNPEKMEAVLENTSVLILGRKISLENEIMPLINTVIATGSKNIAVIGDISGDALRILAFNKFKGNIQSVVIPAPGYGDSRKNNLDDIAVLTGGAVLNDEVGMSPEQLQHLLKNMNFIGTAKKIIATKSTTNIIKYEPDDFKKEAQAKAITTRNRVILERINSLKRQIEGVDSTYDREQLSERLARLTTGIAVIKVGSGSELETNEKLERVKDAVPAVQAALEEGIVPGGAVAFLRAAENYKKTHKTLNPGEQLLCDSLSEPIKKILENAGIEAKELIRILEEIGEKGGNFGYNVLTDKVEDMLINGVYDPLKVIRLALKHSVSVATSALTTDALIAIKYKEDDKNMRMAWKNVSSI